MKRDVIGDTGKIVGMCLLEKLSYIQFYKVDFDFFEQFDFGQKTTYESADSGYFPKERFS